MKFTIEKNVIVENLANVVKAISAKNIIPILNGIKFDLDEQGLQLTASDSDLTIKALIKPEDIESVDKEGSIVIQAKYIIDIVKSMPGEIINFEVVDGSSIIIYCNNMSILDLKWAIIRGLGASLMHSACTAMTAIGFSYVFNNEKSHLEGIFGLFALAILYHATFNAFVQSDYRIVALIMPILLFIPINYIEYKKKKYLGQS